MIIGNKTIIEKNSWLIAVKERDGWDTSIKFRFSPFANCDEMPDFTISHTDMIKISKKFMSLLAVKLGLHKYCFQPELKHCCMDGWVVEDTIWFDSDSKKLDKILSNLKKALDDIDEDITDLVQRVAKFQPRSDDDE